MLLITLCILCWINGSVSTIKYYTFYNNIIMVIRLKKSYACQIVCVLASNWSLKHKYISIMGHSLHIASKQYCEKIMHGILVQYTHNTTQVRIKKSFRNGFSTFHCTMQNKQKARPTCKVLHSVYNNNNNNTITILHDARWRISTAKMM